MIPFNQATKEMNIYAKIFTQKRSGFLYEDVYSVLILLDIPYNFVVQHKIADNVLSDTVF